MKKALIAASIAAGLAGVANAANTTTLYGAIAYEVQYQHGTGSNYNNQWDLNTDALRVGVKGEEDLNNGLTAFYNVLLDIDGKEGANSTRLAYVGLKGDFGTLTLGKQDSLYKIMTNGNDIFEDAYFDDTMHFGALTGGTRPSKVISYVSPSMGGLTLAAAGILDGDHSEISNGNSQSFNAAQVGAKYEYNGLTVSAAYSWASQKSKPSTSAPTILNNVDIDGDTYDVTIPGETSGGSINGKKQYNVVGGQINYANDQFYVGVGAEHAFGIGSKYNLAGQYFYGPNTFQAGVGYGNSDDLAETADIDAGKVMTYALGYNYNFSKDTFTFVNAQYQHATDTNGEDAFRKGNNGYLVRVGLRHDF